MSLLELELTALKIFIFFKFYISYKRFKGNFNIIKSWDLIINLIDIIV